MGRFFVKMEESPQIGYSCVPVSIPPLDLATLYDRDEAVKILKREKAATKK